MMLYNFLLFSNSRMFEKALGSDTIENQGRKYIPATCSTALSRCSTSNTYLKVLDIMMQYRIYHLFIFLFFFTGTVINLVGC